MVNRIVLYCSSCGISCIFVCVNYDFITLRNARLYFFWRYNLNYVIFDLEWNTAYNYATNQPLNEIIEIGAVKLDSKLNIVDTFKQLIKPTVTKKLTGRCKSLTGITNEQLKEDGVPFEEALKDFSRWSGREDSVFMSWSNSDLYAMCANVKAFLGTYEIAFIKKYCDVQKYCMSFIKNNENNNQIALSKCADIFEIEVDPEKLHRALFDCYVTAECIKKVYDKEIIKQYITDCDCSFFNRLMYKQQYITEAKTDDFDLESVKTFCPECNCELKIIRRFGSINNTFKNVGICKKCKIKYWVYIRAKKTYDDVLVTTRYVKMNSKRAKRIK